MRALAIIASLLLMAASPPPPPPPAPDVAQGEFDGFQGPDLWRAWQRHTRVRTLTLASEAYASARDTGDGYFVRNDGPSLERTTGYWNESYNAEFSEICPRNRPDQCVWVYRAIAVDNRLEVYQAIDLATFNGEALAAALRASGVVPEAFDPDSVNFPASEVHDAAIMPHVSLFQRNSADCPAVGRWRDRLDDQAPLYLSGRAPVSESGEDIPPPPPPPYPIHIRHIIEIPTIALGTADATIRLEDTRSHAMSALWATITDGIADCAPRE